MPAVHPAAELFPMLSGDAYEQFKASLHEHGQREPVVLHEGLILDGRNRWRACTDLGIEPLTRAWGSRGKADGDDPIRFVADVNIHAHRHLDESQRAMLGARLLPMYQEAAKERQAATQAKPGEKVGAKASANLREPMPQAKAAEQAAAAVNVSPRTVENAARVLRDGTSELVEAVDNGEISVSAAAKVAKLPREEQAEALDKPRRGRGRPRKASTPASPSTPRPRPPKKPAAPEFIPAAEAVRAQSAIQQVIDAWPKRYWPTLAAVLRNAAERISQ